MLLIYKSNEDKKAFNWVKVTRQNLRCQLLQNEIVSLSLLVEMEKQVLEMERPCIALYLKAMQ